MRRGASAMALVALMTLGLAAAPAQASPTAARVLTDDDFGFCHDPRYPLTDEEARWCAVLPEPNPGCPAFRPACTAPRAILEGEPGPLSRRSAGDQPPSDEWSESQSAPKEPDRANEPPKRVRGPEDRRRNAPREDDLALRGGGMGPLPQILVWIIVIGMLVLLLTQLRGPGLPDRSRAGDPEAPRPGTPARDRDPEPRAAERLDVDGLLDRAQQHAQAGRLDAAVNDGHAALLQRLAEQGRIELHPSRTNGDHVRDLRADPALYDPARQVMRVVERVQFGHAPPSRAEVDGLLVHVRSMLSTLVGVLVLALCTLACSPTPGRDYPWSHSPSGTAGVLTLLRGHDLEVEYRKTLLETPPPIDRVPVVLDGAELTDQEWAVLLHHVDGGGSAVLATTEPLPAAVGIGWAEREPGSLRPGRGDPLPGLVVVVPGSEGLTVPPTATVVRTDAEGIPYALRMDYGEGSLLVLADDALLTNAALAVADDGAWLVVALSQLGRRFELVDGGLRALSGLGAADPFEAVARLHLTPVLVQGLVLMLLLYLWRGVHFGRPRDPPPPSRRRFTEHAEALAQHYLRAGARRHALRLYSGWALERIHERFGGTRGGLPALAQRIAARTGTDSTQITRILVEAQHARDEGHDYDPRGDAEDLRVLRELGRLVETTRGR